MTDHLQSGPQPFEEQPLGQWHPSDAHPDADQLSAFAENALPAPEREATLLHLAECAHCRNVVALATDAAFETAAAEPASVPQSDPEPDVPARGWRFAGWRLLWPAGGRLATAAMGLAVVAAGLLTVELRVHRQPSSSHNASTVSVPPAAQTAAVEAPPPPPSAAPLRKPEAPEPAAAPLAKQKTTLTEAPPPDPMTAPKLAYSAKPQLPSAAGSVPSAASSAAAASLANGPVRSTAAPAPLAAVSPQITAAPQVAAASPAPKPLPAIASAAPVPQVRRQDLPGGALPASPAVNGGSASLQQAAPAPASPPAVAAPAAQPATGSVPQSAEALPRAAEGKIARQASPLPSRLRIVSVVSQGSRTLAVDTAGKLFLSLDAGQHWAAVQATWQGSVTSVGPIQTTDAKALRTPTASMFELHTSAGERWTSRDGVAWRR